MSWFESLLQDVRFGWRNLVRTPGVTITATLSLALGIMAATAMYSVIYGVVINPFPYKDVDNLASVLVKSPEARGGRINYVPDHFLEIAERSTIFEGVIASTISDVLWTGESQPHRLRGNYGTFNTFDVMGVPPLLGRTYLPSDAAPDAEAVVVLGFKFWTRQFAADPQVLGRRLQLNGKTRTVIGVMPRRFMWRGADVYLPVVFQRGQAVEGIRSVHLLGRLKPGITAAQAEADLAPIIAELQRSAPGEYPKQWRVSLLSFKETFPSGMRETLWVLFGAVGLLLLISCANVSNLLLSKAAPRRREMAVRASLGAGRARLLRQLLTESLLLASGGGALGVALAFGALKAILAIIPPGTLPDESEVVINLPVLLFTTGVSAFTAILFGLAPSIHGASINLAQSLKESGRGLSGGIRTALLRNGLVVTEVALSLMLLAGASLMARTFITLRETDLGIRPERLLTMRVPLPEQHYSGASRRSAFFQELLARLESTPGVVAAGLNAGVHPMGGLTTNVEISGGGEQPRQQVRVSQVNAGYFRAIGIDLLQGRVFTTAEIAGKQRLVVVNQTFLRRFLADQNPLGRGIRMPALRNWPFQLEDDGLQIVGVVKDALNRGVRSEVWPEVYLPYTLSGGANWLTLRAAGDPTALAPVARAQIYAIDKNQPVTDVGAVERLLADWIYAGPRFNVVLFSIFAGLGLALAVIGVYGVISNSVTQQTREIGVRIALGASSRDVSAMVVARGLKLLIAGVALGLAGSFASVRLIREQVWNVSPFDPISFASMSAILLVAGLLASVVPARRASRTDPIEALRQE